MVAIHWTVGARDDLREIVRYISRDSPVRAQRVAGRIITAVERLATFPTMGPMVPEYGDALVRQVTVGSYRVIYTLREDGIGVVAVIHGARDLVAYLGHDPHHVV